MYVPKGSVLTLCSFYWPIESPQYCWIQCTENELIYTHVCFLAAPPGRDVCVSEHGVDVLCSGVPMESLEQWGWQEERCTAGSASTRHLNHARPWSSDAVITYRVHLSLECRKHAFCSLSIIPDSSLFCLEIQFWFKLSKIEWAIRFV